MLNTESWICAFYYFQKDKIDHIFRKPILGTKVCVRTWLCIPLVCPQKISSVQKWVGNRLNCLSKTSTHIPENVGDWEWGKKWICLFGKKLDKTHKHESRFSPLCVRAPFPWTVGTELGLCAVSNFTKWHFEHSLVSQQRPSVLLPHKSPAWDPAHLPE